ncbi:replication initiator protein A [Alcaligenes phenolicus]|uniref:Replication initiator protein A n=1 Tax=Alcaligenes phenolicus TaxID=232846 RepID=A0AAW5VLR6_9BURK|nr:replication initiator protein A [Alcaligenes phenolicus]MCX5563756.1 replication initiator protein A [Alcaligenes phenolicus]
MRITRHMLPVQGPVQLRLFHALPGGTGIRDQQDLMSYPFFSLAKGARAKPIEYEQGQVSILVEGVVEIGIATIWDADVLIWAASQIAAAHNLGMPTSRYMASSMHDILRFIGRGVSLRDYQRLRAALDRLQSTTVITTLRAGNLRKQHRFSWINEWRELAHTSGRSAGLEVILPDWFYAGVKDESMLLSLHPGYFQLTGGLARWLYRLARKHGGRQRGGWRFPLRHLHTRSGSVLRYSDFSLEIRKLAARALLDYHLWIEKDATEEFLCFRSTSRR